jgi:hypothetical protein
MTDTETEMRALLDREAIRDLAARYCHRIWNADPRVAELYTTDGRFSLRAPDGRTVSHQGRDAIDRYYRDGFADPKRQARPYTSSHVIELLGAGRATGRLHADIRLRQDDDLVLYVGYWQDEYARVDGEWRIKVRDFTLLYSVRLKPVQD